LIQKAFAIIKNKNSSWFSDVALNYSQLNFDYSVTSRVDSDKFDYFIIDDDKDLTMFNNYSYTIIINAGVILGYSYYEKQLRTLIEHAKEKVISLVDGRDRYLNGYIYKPNGVGVTTMLAPRSSINMPFVNGDDSDQFSMSHAPLQHLVTLQSNMTYVIHNEYPKINIKSNNKIDYAITVGSGFYINHILEDAGFNDNATVLHTDVSPIGLMVRQYTIENWNGHYFYDWIEHLNEHFPSLKVYSRGKFNSKNSITKELWQHTLDTFGNNWIPHWERYQKLNHQYEVCNFSDTNKLKRILRNSNKQPSMPVFWWDGAMKRLPGNLFKNSNQSHIAFLSFLNVLKDFSNNMACYGGDHCAKEWYGENIQTVINESKTNSRDELWKTI